MKNLTVKALLNNPSLSKLVLKGGNNKIQNEIYNVNIIDNPDTYDWLSAGDFLLTTGYIVKDSPDMQKKMIRELASINCAGIGIKIKRYFQEIPEIIINEANKCGLPLVQIPFEYNLSYVSNIINNDIFKREDSLLRRSVRIHDALNECVIEGGDLDQICRVLANLINNPVIITNSKWRLLTYCDVEDSPIDLINLIDIKTDTSLFDSGLTETLPEKYNLVGKAVKRSLPDPSGKTDVGTVCQILPIASNKENYGYLIVPEITHKMGYIDHIAMETAAVTIMLERIKTKKIEEARHSARLDFFDDLLEGKIESVNAINNLAEIHNLNSRKRYICLVTKFYEDNDGEQDPLEYKIYLSSFKKLALDGLEAVFAKHRILAASINRGNLIISFIQMKDEEEGSKAQQIMNHLKDDMVAALKISVDGPRFCIGVSEGGFEILDFKKAYNQAIEAIKIREDLRMDMDISYFENVRVYDLLRCAFDKNKLNSFYSESVGRLVEYDKKNNTDLAETLECYFRERGNITRASKVMFLHRNTFIYRIEKIKEILDTDLSDSRELLELQLGLHIMKTMFL